MNVNAVSSPTLHPSIPSEPGNIVRASTQMDADKNAGVSERASTGVLSRTMEETEAAITRDDARFQQTKSAPHARLNNQELAIKQEISRMEAWQQMVIAHERTHMLVAGPLASAPSYSYQTGPDGKRYITGGEVQFSMPASRDPQVVLENLARVKKAALAPGNASAADMSAAGMAASREIQALREYARIQAQTKIRQAEENTRQYVKQAGMMVQEGHSDFLEHIDILIDDTMTSALSKMHFSAPSLFDMMM